MNDNSPLTYYRKEFSMTDELQRKVDRSVKLIQAAGKVAKEHGQPLEICYSGGKDSDVILELARMSGVEYRAIYKNTTIDPPGTIAHVKANGVEILQPKMTFAQLMAKKSYPHLRADFERVIKQVRERAECFTGSQNKPKTTKAYGR